VAIRGPRFTVWSAALVVQAGAHAATAGFAWLINPVGSAVLAYVRAAACAFTATAATAFASGPRITGERVTFTGAASGATVGPCALDTARAANVCTFRTASTGLVLTAGNTRLTWLVPAILTAVGIAGENPPPPEYDLEGDELVLLRAGEGIVFRQPDAGTAADTRRLVVGVTWEEVLS
jgi:hypothetical protein